MLEDSQFKKPKRDTKKGEPVLKKKSKVTFNDLADKGDVKGDDVYEGQKQKIKDKQLKKREQKQVEKEA